MQYMLFSIYVVGYYHVYFKYNLNFNITWLSFTYCFVFFLSEYMFILIPVKFLLVRVVAFSSSLLSVIGLLIAFMPC